VVLLRRIVGVEVLVVCLDRVFMVCLMKCWVGQAVVDFSWVPAKAGLPTDTRLRRWFAEAVLEIFFGGTKRQQETNFFSLSPYFPQ
jgi:hypothetical protein